MNLADGQATRERFGLVGDGVADDTAALEAALKANRSRRMTFLPPGTFMVRRGLNVGSGGLDGSCVSRDGQTVIKAAPDGDFPEGVLWGRRDRTTLRDITVQATGADKGIHLYKCHNSVMENVRVLNANMVGIFFDTCNVGRFVGCSVRRDQRLPDDQGTGDGIWATNANACLFMDTDVHLLRGASRGIWVRSGPIWVDGEVQSWPDRVANGTPEYCTFSGGCTWVHTRVEGCKGIDAAVRIDSTTSLTTFRGGWQEGNDGDAFHIVRCTGAVVEGQRLSGRSPRGEAAFRFSGERTWNARVAGNQVSDDRPEGFSRIVVEDVPPDPGWKYHEMGLAQRPDGSWWSKANRYGSQVGPTTGGLPVVWMEA